MKPSTGTFHPETNTYVTGSGQVLVSVHTRSPTCESFGCVIHNPTDPRRDLPTHFREDTGVMERICPHGIGHPDRDHIAYVQRAFGDDVARDQAIHSCDGCCQVTILPMTQDYEDALE